MTIHQQADNHTDIGSGHDDSIMINGVKYVPFSPGQVLVQKMKSGRTRERFTPRDYQNALDYIKAALDNLGGPLAVFDDYKYADKLYPRDALTVLALSRTRFWPGHDIDAVLETMLGHWLREIIADYGVYAKQLFAAIHELDCSDGVFLRLNLDSVAKSSNTKIRIATRFGCVTTETEPRRDVFTGTTRNRVKQFLHDQSAFINNINVLYRKLQNIHHSFNLEQALLGWMGYLVLRAIAQNSTARIRITNQQLLMPAPPSDTQPPEPNHQTPA